MRTLKDHIFTLYDQTHGVLAKDVNYVALNQMPHDREQDWDALWSSSLALTASSRLLQFLFHQALATHETTLMMQSLFDHYATFPATPPLGVEWVSKNLGSQQSIYSNQMQQPFPLEPWLNESYKLTPSQIILGAWTHFHPTDQAIYQNLCHKQVPSLFKQGLLEEADWRYLIKE